MAYYFAEGSKFYYSSTFASTKNITALSNANPALATSTSHGYVDGDIVLLTSGWEDATNTLYKVDQQDANSYQVLGLNSSDTNWYAAGTGTGTASLVSSWQEIPQVLNVTSQGGDARMTNIEPLASRNSIAVPTGFNPASMTLTLGHDPANATYLAMVNLSRTLTKVGIKIAVSGGGVAYGYGYMSVSEIPQLARNQANTVQCGITLLGRFISY